MRSSLVFLALVAAGGTPVALPGAPGAIGFDDLRWAPAAGRVLVPGGRTGALVLIDPAGGAAAQVTGFSSAPPAGGGHGVGVTSADEGGGRLWVIDRGARRVSGIDPATLKVTASAPLAGGPDYVRWVAPTSEVWVTEPGAKQVEIFTTAAGALRAAAVVHVGDGPESLVVDATRNRAYTHEWGSKTMAIDLATRRVVATWPNGCSGSRGVALDEARGLLFVGCDEGRASVLDVAHDGKLLATSKKLVAGVDIIAYDAARSRLVLPGEDSATMAVLAVSPTGALTEEALLPTVKGAHCATIDGGGGIWVCDPEHGRLLRFPAP